MEILIVFHTAKLMGRWMRGWGVYVAVEIMIRGGMNWDLVRLSNQNFEARSGKVWKYTAIKDGEDAKQVPLCRTSTKTYTSPTRIKTRVLYSFSKIMQSWSSAHIIQYNIQLTQVYSSSHMCKISLPLEVLSSRECTPPTIRR
jgi:hypothetical protein